MADPDDAEARWWLLLGTGSVAFVLAVPWLLPAWNPRYALFFMWPLWMVGAVGVAAVAERLPGWPLRAAWFGLILLIMAPKLLSHFADGTRHDFRTAARVVMAEGSHQVVCNWPATLQYDMQREEPRSPVSVKDWQPGNPLPAGPLVLVFASNAWEPVLRVKGRSVRVVDEVRHRRFDEQSHLIRIYEISAAGPGQSTPAGTDQPTGSGPGPND